MTHTSGRTGMTRHIWDIVREMAAPYHVLDETSERVLYTTKDTCEIRHEVAIPPVADKRRGNISFPAFRAGPDLAGVISRMKVGDELPGFISDIQIEPAAGGFCVSAKVNTRAKGRGRQRSALGWHQHQDNAKRRGSDDE